MGSDRLYPTKPQAKRGCSSTAGCGCRGKDLGPLEDDELPSQEDMERFGDVTRVCPGCKTEVYDDASMCHNCGRSFMRTDTDKGLPTWAIATTVGLLVLLALGVVWI